MERVWVQAVHKLLAIAAATRARCNQTLTCSARGEPCDSLPLSLSSNSLSTSLSQLCTRLSAVCDIRLCLLNPTYLSTRLWPSQSSRRPNAQLHISLTSLFRPSISSIASVFPPRTLTRVINETRTSCKLSALTTLVSFASSTPSTIDYALQSPHQAIFYPSSIISSLSYRLILIW